MYFLVTIYSWCWSCTPEWHFCRSLLSKRLWNLFLCYRRYEQFVAPVTGCSVWDDFVAGSRTIGRRLWANSLLAASNKLVLYLSWRSPVHIGWTKNGVFSNLTVNFQGTCDDGIQLNMTLIWKDRLEVNWYCFPGLRTLRIFSNILAVRTSSEFSSIPRILLKEISTLYLDFLSFSVGSCWTDNFSFATLQD